jgi:hypothetical protein
MKNVPTQLAQLVPDEFEPLATVQFWADAFAKDPQRLAGGMIIKLLNEYAQLRSLIAASQI